MEEILALRTQCRRPLPFGDMFMKVLNMALKGRRDHAFYGFRESSHYGQWEDYLGSDIMVFGCGEEQYLVSALSRVGRSWMTLFGEEQYEYFSNITVEKWWGEIFPIRIPVGGYIAEGIVAVPLRDSNETLVAMREGKEDINLQTVLEEYIKQVEKMLKW